MKTYRDTIHGITAKAPNKMMAWALIRNECKARGIDIPTLDKVMEVNTRIATGAGAF